MHLPDSIFKKIFTLSPIIRLLLFLMIVTAGLNFASTHFNPDDENSAPATQMLLDQQEQKAMPMFGPVPQPPQTPINTTTPTCKPQKAKTLIDSAKEFAPIMILLVVVGIVLGRLPKVDGVEHSSDFRKRRVLNWLPLGLTYAFLYMGRYNIKVSQNAFEEMKKLDAQGNPVFNDKGDIVSLMSNSDFAEIFFWGTLVYGVSFIINGPLTDRKGGKFAILVGAIGTLICNALMGFSAHQLKYQTDMAYSIGSNFVLIYSILYAANMYFQSFGAVAIVKVNAPWFHVRERGVFGAIFGILISLGVYFAFDLSNLILSALGTPLDICDYKPGLTWVFYMPSILLAISSLVVFIWVKNSPGEAGFDDFALGDASDGDDGPQKSAMEVFKMMLKNPVIVTIACIEFCSGFLRQAIMQWYTTFAKQTNDALHLYKFADANGDMVKEFVYGNWGLLLCCAGIMGGVFAGVISDRMFQSRRGPVAAILYGLMLVGAIVLTFVYDNAGIMIGDFNFRPQAWLVIFMSMCIIGVHGMLSGTASMDFGGKKNVGVAVGIIDGFVYAGTAVMSLTYKILLPAPALDPETGKVIGEATNPANWNVWPIAMIPVAIIGLILARKVWDASASGKSSGH